MFDVLDFNPVLKVINITLAYKNDKNDTDIGIAEKKRWIEVVNDISTQTFCYYKEKKDNSFLKTPERGFAEPMFSKIACSKQ